MTGHAWVTLGLLDRDEVRLLKQLLTDCCLTEQHDGHRVLFLGVCLSQTLCQDGGLLRSILTNAL